MALPEQRPFTLQWHITHRCNLRCAHCYQTDYSAFASPDALFNAAEDYAALLETTGRRGFVNLTGGEPMTHPALFDLTAWLREHGIPFALLTNGTLISKREAKQLKAQGVTYVQVSLDGMRRTHDRIRGEGSFDMAVQGLSCLLQAGIDATVSFTAQSENRKDLPRLARFCRDLGVRKLWFDRVVIPAAEDTEGLSLSPKEAAKLMKTASHLARRCPVSCQRALQFLYAGGAPYQCRPGQDHLTLLADGTVLACRRLPLPLGKLPETSLVDIWQTSPLLNELKTHPAQEGCRGCPHENTCRGGAKCIAYAKTGDWRVTDPDCPNKKYKI